MSRQFTLNQVFACILLVGVCAVVGIGYVMVNREAERYNETWRNDNLSKSAAFTSSYYSAIIPKIILDKQDEVNRLLQGIKEGEGLKAAYILPQSAISMHVLESCQLGSFKTYFRQSPTCYEYTLTSFRIYHELLSAGQNVGYLVKEMDLKPFQRFGSTAFVQYLLLVLVWLVAIVAAALFFFRQFVMRPTRHMIGLIKNGGDIGKGVDGFRLKELRALASSLQQSLDTNKEYQERTKQLEFDAELGKLSSRIAHDIRSPLSSMCSALMLLREKFGKYRDAEDMLNLLQLSSNRLDNISNGLLAKYMGEASVEQLFSIHEILDELIGELQASALGQGTKFKKHYSGLALYVLGDKTGMARAIGNIIKNALEAMQNNPADKPKQLIVSTEFCQPQEGNVCIRIADTGPGIPADKIPLILQGGHTEGKEDGHGIGTKVVKEMVEAHKGKLSIESQVGVGTSFVISLPATIQNDETVITIPHLTNAAVCVIDDEPSLREQWRLTLKAQGVDALIFTCWEEIDSVKKAIAPQSTFIVDYHFDNSEVDGLEIIRRLKGIGFNQFVLATAEYWKPAIKESAKQLNVILCPKPLPKVVVQPVVIANPEGVKQSSGLHEIASSQAPRNDISGPSILLIDDDPDIQTTWKLMRGMLGVGKLTMYSKLEEMIAAATNPADYDLCIIDKNVTGSQFDGAKMLAHLKENGARKVFLASGEGRQQIEDDPQFSTIDGIMTEKVPMSLTKYLS